MFFLNFSAARSLILIFFSAFIFSGCTTVSYKSNSASSAAKPADYPIPVYTEDQPIPRPCRVIGTVSINAGKMTMFGGSADAETIKLMQYAHEKGADAVKVTSMEKPDFANPNYRLKADLLCYTDMWEKVSISEKDFQLYLLSNRQHLDPVEGIWFSGGFNPHTVGIIRNKSKPGRDFVAFILNSRNPVWTAGMKKMEIRHGLAPGSYVLTYYLDDFSSRETSFVLQQKNTFGFLLEKSGENGNLITYTRF